MLIRILVENLDVVPSLKSAVNKMAAIFKMAANPKFQVRISLLFISIMRKKLRPKCVICKNMFYEHNILVNHLVFCLLSMIYNKKWVIFGHIRRLK